MSMGKIAYLDEITTHHNMRSIDIGENVDGSSPPSVFIGRWGYPKVLAGPMLALQKGDTYVMDSPDSWIPQKKTQADIISYRLGLVRGKRFNKVEDLDSPLVSTIQEIALAKTAVESEAKFKKAPRGVTFS